jgi:hypothetical protein
MINNIKNLIKSKYYTYQPGEFLPIFSDGKLLNSREFHFYRIKWMIRNRKAAIYQFTHYAG